MQKAIGLGLQHRDTVKEKLELPQKLAILVLFLFNSKLLTYIPFSVGPVTPTIGFEYLVVLLMVPWLKIYDRKLGARDKYLLVVGACMFVLSLINQGIRGEQQYSIIFNSLYVYALIVFSFSGRPDYRRWLRRLHLMPMLGNIYEISLSLLAIFKTSSIIESQVSANKSASYLAMLLPVCWIQFRRERGFFRFLNAFVIVGTMLSIVVTTSRTALVIFAVMMLLMAIVDKTSRWLIVLLVPMALFFFLLPEQSVFMERMSALRDPVSELSSDRFVFWRIALHFIKQHPLTGGDYRAVVRKLVFEVAPESSYAYYIRHGVIQYSLGIHNGYLAVLVNFGLIVGFLYFGYFFLLGGAIYRIRQFIQGGANRQWLIAGFVVLVGYAIGNIPHHFYLGHDFFTIWAILQASLQNVIVEEDVKDGDAISDPKR
jgi:hypothetical protein